jgi:hypothetical protein
MAELEREIHERISALTPGQQRRVLEYIDTLAGERPRGVPGHTLERFAGIWTKEEADEVMRVIEEHCERVDPNGW